MTPEEAVALATRVHKGQIDKAGKPYIDHVRRVVDAVTTPRERIVAALHDVVEDTTVTLEELHSLGCPEEVIAAVEALTKRSGDDKVDYYRRVASNPLALVVKRADVADNSDPERLALLPDEMADRRREKVR